MLNKGEMREISWVLDEKILQILSQRKELLKILRYVFKPKKKKIFAAIKIEMPFITELQII